LTQAGNPVSPLLDLRRALADELDGVPCGPLREASRSLTSRYRRTRAVDRLSDAERLAYATVRAPATCAALLAVFEELRARTPQLTPATLLDLGAGPGTSLWAASALWPIRSATLLDRDAGFLTLGARLWARCDRSRDVATDWLSADLANPPALPAHDLVVLSYVLGELTEHDARALVERALEASTGAVVAVEPGTPEGFRRILHARSAFLAQGARLVAPCPHESACPLAGHDWCHFAARLSRGREHRYAKEAERGWEDEKYSYVGVTRASGHPVAARVIRHPRTETGRVTLQLCTETGLERRVVTRRNRQKYREARDAGWGSGLSNR
jgi:ribosomal protein RSM22 (predicted rRNA methylase)